MLPIQSIGAILLGSAIGFSSWGYMMPQADPTQTLLLVNKQNKAPTLPLTLCYPEVLPVEERYAVNTAMRPDAASALAAMFQAAQAEDVALYALSGFRSYSTQKAIFERKKQERGEKAANRSSAKAGYSEHQTGLAMDYKGASTLRGGLSKDIGASPEGQWVAENCWRYGFIVRYPEDQTGVTGYIYEPWHVRYVGKETAERMHALGNPPFEHYIDLVRRERISAMEGEAHE